MNPIFKLSNTKEEIMDGYDEDIIITTREGVIIKVTQISGEHYAITPVELLGKSIFELEAQGIFTPPITPTVVEQRKKVVTVQMTPSGRKVLITGIPLFNESGEVEFVISYSHELSELIVIKDYLKDLEIEMSSVKEELAYWRGQHLGIGDSIMESPASVRAAKTALKMAQFDVPAVIQGERGVGKTELAKFIHTRSKRKDGPFIVVNCGTLPEGVSLLKWGYQEARLKASTASGPKTLVKSGTQTVLDIWLGLIPLVMALGTLALMIAEYTPVFRIISYPLIPVLTLLGLPEAAEAAPTFLVGFADMFLPAVLGSGIDSEMTRFVIAGISLTQLIYMSEIGILILRSNIPVKFWELLVIFNLRTIITLPVLVLFAHLFIG